METLKTITVERMSPLTPLSPAKIKERKFGRFFKGMIRKRRNLEIGGDTGDSGDRLVIIMLLILI